MKRWLGMTWCAVLFTGACTQDSPTEAGAGLLPVDAIRTFEIVLGPERWLQWDTAFGLYTATADADFVLLADQYEGVLNSRALLRYQIPRTITVLDTAGVLRIDSLPMFFAGEVRFVVDTLTSTAAPAAVQLFSTTEPWDRLTATWSLRVDSPGVRVPWTQAGGSPGALIGAGSYAESDTVSVPVDSATLAQWQDTTIAGRGAVLRPVTPGTRLRTTLPALRLSARSTINPDTVVEFNIAPGRTFIFSPEQPDFAGTPRVGGTPLWRTVLRLRERLDTVRIACPGIPDCSVPLGATSINHAAVQLQPVPAPPGFAPEAPIFIALHALLSSPLLPLQRSPVSQAYGATLQAVPVSSFMAPGAPIVELPATELMRLIFAQPTTTATPAANEAVLPTHIALLPIGSQRTFGFGTFAELPSLRIIVSIARELQLP